MLKLVIPKLEEYWYEEKLQNDKDTMSYNAGYDVSYEGYHYDTGCIDFPKSEWKETYLKRQSNDKFFFYIKDLERDCFIGYCNYHYNKNEKYYECGLLIEAINRNKGYSKEALKLLCREAKENGVTELYDTFELDRENTLDLFVSVGFEIVERLTWKKFDKEVNGVKVKITL